MAVAEVELASTSAATLNTKATTMNALVYHGPGKYA
jgi:hypothetical protein